MVVGEDLPLLFPDQRPALSRDAPPLFPGRTGDGSSRQRSATVGLLAGREDSMPVGRPTVGPEGTLQRRQVEPIERPDTGGYAEHGSRSNFGGAGNDLLGNTSMDAAASGRGVPGLPSGEHDTSTRQDVLEVLYGGLRGADPAYGSAEYNARRRIAGQMGSIGTGGARRLDLYSTRSEEDVRVMQ